MANLLCITCDYIFLAQISSFSFFFCFFLGSGREGGERAGVEERKKHRLVASHIHTPLLGPSMAPAIEIHALDPSV